MSGEWARNVRERLRVLECTSVRLGKKNGKGWLSAMAYGVPVRLV